MTENFEVRRDVVYRRAAVRSPENGEKELALDLYLPAAARDSLPRPALIAMHGGGFVGGQKSGPTTVVGLCRELAARGIVCASIQYRLMSDDPPTEGANALERVVRAAVEDGAAAVQWLRERANEFDVDPHSIAVGGSSAGAVVALLLGYHLRIEVSGVVALWGTLRDHVGSIEAGGPPLFLLHGQSDELVPIADARDIVNRAREVGLHHESYLVAGGHGVPLSLEVEGRSFYERIADFVIGKVEVCGERPAEGVGTSHRRLLTNS